VEADFSSSVDWTKRAERRSQFVRHSPLLALLRRFVLLPSYLLVLLIRLLKWLVAPCALLAQLVIGVPLTLTRIRQPLRPRFVPLQESELPNAAWIALTDASDSLAADGFSVYGDFRCDEMIQGAVLRLRCMGRTDLGICALAAHVELATGARPVREFIEFSTGFRDGRVLVTNNLDLPYSLPPPAYLARVQLKDVWDPRALLALHRDLIASLPETVDLEPAARAARDPAGCLADHCTREIRALIDAGWLRPSAGSDDRIRLRLRGALIGVWRQAWPLGSLYLRAADRRSRRLLAEHGQDVDQFAGGAMTVRVSTEELAATAPIDTVIAGYQHALPLARQIDSGAALEAVVVELEHDASKAPVPREFRYSFRAFDDWPERRIRRYRSFDILLDPAAGTLAATAMERDFEQATDEADWTRLLAAPPGARLRIGPWTRDLDRVVPAALSALAERAEAKGAALDSASLYLDDGRPCWQMVAWTSDDTPHHVVLDARTGAVLND